MIQPFIYNKKSELKLSMILDLIKHNPDSDFYFTHDNQRIYIKSIAEVKQFIKNSHKIFLSEDERTDYNGLIAIVKSIGGDTIRYYVKMVAPSDKIADRLLTVLLWNVKNELYVKINKRSRFLKTFYNKGFIFVGGRGIQVLLKKPKEIIHELNTKRFRDNSSQFDK